MKKVNSQARNIVQRASDKGMTYEEIAKICGVSLGSVKRWVATGRARASAIQPLVDRLGKTLLSAESVADTLMAIYAKRGRRFRIRASDLVAIAGRCRLRDAFLAELEDALDERSCLLIRGFAGGEDLFFVERWGQYKKHVSYTLGEKEIEEYYQDVAEDIEDAEADDKEQDDSEDDE